MTPDSKSYVNYKQKIRIRFELGAILSGRHTAVAANRPIRIRYHRRATIETVRQYLGNYACTAFIPIGKSCPKC